MRCAHTQMGDLNMKILISKLWLTEFISNYICHYVIQFLYLRFKTGWGILFYLCPSFHQSIHPLVSLSVRPMNIFVTFFAVTKFCYSVYISQLYLVVRFQIHFLTTSCLSKYFGWLLLVSSCSQFHLLYINLHTA